MKILSCMTRPDKRDGHWTFWREGISMALAYELGAELGATVEFEFIPYGGGKIKNIKTGYDLAFVPFGWFPDNRPAKFIYTFASDVIGHEDDMLEWMNHVKPDLIGCLQDKAKWMMAWGTVNDCRIELLPWFITHEVNYNENRTVAGMCTGAIGPSYPFRRDVARYLQKNYPNNPDVIVSCGPYGKYPLSRKDYLKNIMRARYYFSGGIHDRFIPPKYYEVMNYGCCLVSPQLEWMEDNGFVHGFTYLDIDEVEEIDQIIHTDHWETIGQRGRDMVQKYHTVGVRAKRIKEIYNGYIKRNS